MKQFRIAILMALSMVVGSMMAAEKQFASPDGNVIVKVSDEGGKPVYQVSLGGTVFLNPSALGLYTNIGDLTTGLTMKDCQVGRVSDTYSLKTIKQSQVTYEATEAVCQFEHNGRQVLDVIFRVSNRDVAFRYKLYPRRARGGETLVAVVTGEASGFVFPEGTTTFLCPQSRPMGGFARTSPSYETGYALDDQMGKNGYGEGYSFPCLFKNGDKGWMLPFERGWCELQNRFPATWRTQRSWQHLCRRQPAL